MTDELEDFRVADEANAAKSYARRTIALKPASRKDVAREAGVSEFTVSVALRGRAGVAAATRLRVLAVAKQLGYQPNGAAAYLAQRRAGGTAKRRLVGYLTAPSSPEPDFFAACAERGWDGALVPVEKFVSPEQATRVLWQQGYDGLLVATGPHLAPFWDHVTAFGWGRFAAVKMSRALPQLALHLVRHDPFDYMITTLEAVWQRGYRKLAVVLHTSSSRRDDQARLGAVMVFAAEHAGEPGFTCAWRRQPIGQPSEPIVDGACVAWLRHGKPDVVVMDLEPMVRDLIAAGVSVPGEMAAAAVITNIMPHAGSGSVTGCDNQGRKRYVEALRLLEEQLLSGRRGPVDSPQEVVVKPQWVDGVTAPHVRGRLSPGVNVASPGVPKPRRRVAR